MEMRHGSLTLARLILGGEAPERARVQAGAHPVAATVERHDDGWSVVPAQPVTLAEGEALRVEAG